MEKVLCENYERIKSSIVGDYLIRYEYKHPSGRLFRCYRKTLEMCRESRNYWVKLNMRVGNFACPHPDDALVIDVVGSQRLVAGDFIDNIQSTMFCSICYKKFADMNAVRNSRAKAALR